MKKKTNIRTLIRTIVREEVAMAIGEVITELKQPSKVKQQVSKPKPKKKIVEKKQFSKNSIINEVLNETAQDDEWKTLGGGTYDSSKVNDIMSSQYGDMMGGDSGKVNADAMVASMGVHPDKAPESIKNALTKDYSGLLKAMDKKVKEKRP